MKQYNNSVKKECTIRLISSLSSSCFSLQIKRFHLLLPLTYQCDLTDLLRLLWRRQKCFVDKAFYSVLAAEEKLWRPLNSPTTGQITVFRRLALLFKVLNFWYSVTKTIFSSYKSAKKNRIFDDYYVLVNVNSSDPDHNNKMNFFV